MSHSESGRGTTAGQRLATDGGETVRRDASRLPEAAVRDLLADDRRRRILSHLDGADGPVPVADVARALAAAAADDSGSVSEEAYDEIRREIYQEHLPKLTATEVVRYDSLVGAVELETDDERLLGDRE